jgi:hypothetical protein
MAVVMDLKLMFPTDSVLEVFNGRAGELDDRAAAEADQVIMVSPPVKIFVISLLASQVYLFNKPTPNQEL